MIFRNKFPQKKKLEDYHLTHKIVKVLKKKH